MTSENGSTASLMERKIAHANEVTHLHGIHTTHTTIKFLRKKNELNNEITAKHRNLFKEIRHLDDAAIILDKNDEECVHEDDIPDGQAYADRFIIETDDKRGMTYVQCKVKSKFSIYDIKYGTLNIMQYLKNHNVFLQVRKFKTSIEATIGFLSCQHPKATLKQDLREDLDLYLKTVPLKPEEITLLNEPRNEDEMEEENKVSIPAYDIVPNKFGFGNGTERITTYAFEIRCDPSDAKILKKLFARISLSSTSKISFMLTGMVQLSGQKIYKKMLAEHNEYLSKFATFPLYDTTPEEMSQIREELLRSGSIKRILKTKSSDKNGRWLIETTSAKQYNAQKHCDEVITNFTSDFQTDSTPTRINPDLANEELMMMSIAMEKKYPDLNQKETTAFQHAPPGRAPIMAAYNLEPSVQKTSYKQAVTQNSTEQNQEVEIIDATYTEIDWETKMETMRQNTIVECTKMTATLIKESEEKLLKKTQTLKILINTKTYNQATKMMDFMTFFQASFQRLENHIAITPRDPVQTSKIPLKLAPPAVSQELQQKDKLNERKRDAGDDENNLHNQSPGKK